MFIIWYSSPKKKHATFIEMDISALAINTPLRTKIYNDLGLITCDFKKCARTIGSAKSLAETDCPDADRKLRYIYKILGLIVHRRLDDWRHMLLPVLAI